MPRNNDDFLSAAGFSTEEQKRAERDAKSEASLSQEHHDAFHESMFDHDQARQMYDISGGDEAHLKDANDAAYWAGVHHQIYQQSTGRSLVEGGDGTCTHCGKGYTELP